MKYLTFLLAIVFLCSCGDSRGSLPPGSSSSGFHVGSLLNTIGAWLIYGGCGGIVLGGLAFGLSFVGPIGFIATFLGGIRSLLLLVVEVGAGLLLAGSCFVWLGNNPWVIGAVMGLIGLAIIVRCRHRIGQWMDLPTSAPAIITASSAPVTPGPGIIIADALKKS